MMGPYMSTFQPLTTHQSLYGELWQKLYKMLLVALLSITLMQVQHVPYKLRSFIVLKGIFNCVVLTGHCAVPVKHKLFYFFLTQILSFFNLGQFFSFVLLFEFYFFWLFQTNFFLPFLHLTNTKWCWLTFSYLIYHFIVLSDTRLGEICISS